MLAVYDRGRQPFYRSHHLVATLVLRDMCQPLRNRLRPRRNPPRNSAVSHQCGYHINNKLSHHLVGTLTDVQG